ncbi:MAG: 50S ribosomal protein L7ae [Clostridia bacterium]|nr:50S ribosomal protein L7ae [Clostridia bacterium]
MTQDKLLSLLGICRAAGRLNWGHDACLQSVLHGRARICLLAADASERLHREFRRAAADHDTTVLETHYTMQQFSDATGYRAGVLTTEDEGFAKKLAALYPNCIKGGLTAYDQ